MAHDDPFTLDLFGNTALSSSFNLGVTAFAPAFGDGTDDDPPPATPAPAPATPQSKTPMRAKIDFRLEGSRTLSRTWRERALDNIAAIQMAAEIERQDRTARPDEQEKLIRFTGFGASELANGMFRRPGEEEFRKGWEGLANDLESSVKPVDYASLSRCTQYAHFTPEFIVRAICSALIRMGFSGGRILEPGIGTGLFPALMPDTLSRLSHVTGVELDPVTARIVRLLQPRAEILNQDFARTTLPDHFDLAIGNPPFSDRTDRTDRTVRSDPAFRTLGFRLHDFFIVKAIDRLKPGGLAAFVTSTGALPLTWNSNSRCGNWRRSRRIWPPPMARRQISAVWRLRHRVFDNRLGQAP